VSVEAGNPVQRLLDNPNPFWTRGDLWRATETYLGLWGSAYWGLERDEAGQIVEIWPLRSDRMRVIPDRERYIKGFVYVGQSQQMVPYVPEDIVWMHYFNPLDEYAGLSPIAPLRLSADMGMDALRANRNVLSNDASPGLVIETSDTPTDAEIGEFYERWESRFRGVEKSRRPTLLSAGMKASNLGFSPRDMEYMHTLRWSLEDVARVYGVPRPMIGDIERATYSNFQVARRVFWEDTIIPQLIFYQEALQQHLLPQFGDPSLFVEFDLSKIEALRDTENHKASRRKTYVDAGIMTVDEVRADMNLPPLG
jgi:HK97 family phage portal protein